MIEPVQVAGLRDLRRELRAADKQLPRRLRTAQKNAAEWAAERTRSGARTATQRMSAGQVRAGATQRVAKISFSRTKAKGFTLGAWFGARRYPQFPAWVGNQFDAGDAGPPETNGFPYVLADVLERDKDEFLDIYVDELDQLMRHAFPKGRL